MTQAPYSKSYWIAFPEEVYTFAPRDWRKAGRIMRRITKRYSVETRTRRTVQIATRKHRARKKRR